MGNPVVELSETLKVINRGSRGLRLSWNSRKYDINPMGGVCYMPFECVKLYFGDPRCTNNMRTIKDSIGIVSFLPDRATEVRRLRLLYAAPFGEYMSNVDLGGIFQSDPKEAHEIGKARAFEGVSVPNVEVYNIQDQRIFTILDDPEGLDTIPVQVTAAQRNDLEILVGRQASIIDALAAKLGIDPNGPALLNSPDVTGEVPEEDEEVDLTSQDLTPPSPNMVYDPEQDEIRESRPRRRKDPSSLEEVPTDRI